MVSGELTININACWIQSPECQDIIQAVLHARVGHQQVKTQPVKAQKSKQFTWDAPLLLKFKDQRVLNIWLTDVLRPEENYVIGQCRINLDVIDKDKIELFLFWNQKEAAIIEVLMNLDQKGTTYVAPQKRTKKLFLKFNIRSADILKNTELIGSMKPSVRVQINKQMHETYNSKGKQPTWNQAIVFENVQKTDHVQFTLVDKEMIGDDDLIGHAITTVEALKEEKSYTVDINFKNQKAGSLTFDVKQYYE